MSQTIMKLEKVEIERVGSTGSPLVNQLISGSVFETERCFCIYQFTHCFEVGVLGPVIVQDLEESSFFHVLFFKKHSFEG